jgi:CobQ-like glutamine amidotransferase family enzyme
MAEVVPSSQPAAGESAVRIALPFPDLLGTYGDGGNALVLARRLTWRGFPVETVVVAAGEVVPDSCDLYVLGGGEDGPQVEATRELEVQGALHRAVDRGAVVLAVCAGMQILGHRFPDLGGTPRPGLGLLDCETVRVDAPRAVGELLVATDPAWGLPALTGFENHGGRTRLGPSARRLGTVEVGEGNGGGDEGVVNGRVLGTYLHGPALARNPALADLLLGWVVGEPLAPLTEADTDADALRRVRIRAARQHELQPRRSWRDVIRRG